MYIIVLSDKFQKQISALAKSDPVIKRRLTKILNLLTQDVDHPSLRLHKLSGQDYWSISVTKSIRIISYIENDKVYLLQIGKHEEVY